VTAVDVGMFTWRLRGRHGVLAAEVPALVLSAAVSWALHRAVTFRDDPYRRWLSQHDAFTAAAVVAGAVDCGVTAGLLAVTGRRDTRAALAAKLPAVAVAGAVRWGLHRRVLFRVVRAGHVPLPDRPPGPGDVRLSVVIPAFNEAERIAAAVSAVRAAVDDVEVVVVDDGSTDGTGDTAKAAGADVVVVQPSNRGKGAAVRAGVLAAHGRTIAFTDADLAY
jgi:putative flippase GtrA